MNTKQKEFSKKEIIDRLKWFHGDEMSKYPLTEEILKAYQKERGF